MQYNIVVAAVIHCYLARAFLLPQSIANCVGIVFAGSRQRYNAHAINVASCTLPIRLVSCLQQAAHLRRLSNICASTFSCHILCRHSVLPLLPRRLAIFASLALTSVPHFNTLSLYHTKFATFRSNYKQFVLCRRRCEDHLCVSGAAFCVVFFFLVFDFSKILLPLVFHNAAAAVRCLWHLVIGVYFIAAKTVT